MFIVHRGAGGLAPAFGLLSAISANVLTYKIFGGSYYEDHRWPKLTVLIVSGIACLVAGIWIKKLRQRNAHLEQQAIDSLNPKNELANALAFHGPRDHLMYIPLQYWCIPYFLGAILYAMLGSSAPPSAVSTQSSNSQLNVASTPVKENELMARQVKETVVTYTQDKRGRINAKEAIAAMAAVVGERCLDAAGEIPVRTHEFEPGQRAFSDKINVLLTGDQSLELEAIPGNSVFGTIRDELAGTRFDNHFPSLKEVFQSFAAGIGKTDDWGKAPLSLPAKYWPEKLPLRVTFDTRLPIDAAVQSIAADKVRVLHVCTLALSMMFKDERLAQQLEPSTAMTLTFETINGMAKTVPLKDKAIDKPTQAMKEAQHQVLRIEPR